MTTTEMAKELFEDWTEIDEHFLDSSDEQLVSEAAYALCESTEVAKEVVALMRAM